MNAYAKLSNATEKLNAMMHERLTSSLFTTPPNTPFDHYLLHMAHDN